MNDHLSQSHLDGLLAATAPAAPERPARVPRDDGTSRQQRVSQGDVDALLRRYAPREPAAELRPLEKSVLAKGDMAKLGFYVSSMLEMSPAMRAALAAHPDPLARELLEEFDADEARRA